jgi:predicted methyltransferase
LRIKSANPSAAAASPDGQQNCGQDTVQPTTAAEAAKESTSTTTAQPSASSIPPAATEAEDDKTPEEISGSLNVRPVEPVSQKWSDGSVLTTIFCDAVAGSSGRVVDEPMEVDPTSDEEDQELPVRNKD